MSTTQQQATPTTPVEAGSSGTFLVFEHLVLVWRRFFTSAVLESVVSPLLYLVSLGVGLGSLVDRGGGHPLGVPYLQFVAPALLAATAVQIGLNEAAWPTLSRFKWVPVYRAMTATPLTARQIANGTALFVVLRMSVACLLYYLLICVFGAGGGGRGVGMVPVAVLTGFACAVWVLVLAARTTGEGGVFIPVFRFVLVPMTLFSGSFFPIDRMPVAVRWIAWISPLWHGNELARGFELGRLPLWPALGHAALLLLLGISGLAVARRSFRVRLVE